MAAVTLRKGPERRVWVACDSPFHDPSVRWHAKRDGEEDSKREAADGHDARHLCFANTSPSPGIESGEVAGILLHACSTTEEESRGLAEKVGGRSTTRKWAGGKANLEKVERLRFVELYPSYDFKSCLPDHLNPPEFLAKALAPGICLCGHPSQPASRLH
jgi:hypothetical protein